MLRNESFPAVSHFVMGLAELAKQSGGGGLSPVPWGYLTPASGHVVSFLSDQLFIRLCAGSSLEQAVIM